MGTVLNTKINNKNVTYVDLSSALHSDVIYSQCGVCYGIYNEDFLYIHVAFNARGDITHPKNETFLNLPVKINPSKCRVIGVLQLKGSSFGFIGISATSDGKYLYCNDGFVAGSYLIMDLMLDRN